MDSPSIPSRNSASRLDSFMAPSTTHPSWAINKPRPLWASAREISALTTTSFTAPSSQGVFNSYFLPVIVLAEACSCSCQSWKYPPEHSHFQETTSSLRISPYSWLYLSLSACLTSWLHWLFLSYCSWLAILGLLKLPSSPRRLSTLLT